MNNLTKFLAVMMPVVFLLNAGPIYAANFTVNADAYDNDLPIGPGTYTNIFNTLNPNLLKESGKEVYVDSLFFNLASTYNVTVFATNAPDTSLPTGFSFRRVDLIADKVTGLEDFTWINGVDDATDGGGVNGSLKNFNFTNWVNGDPLAAGHYQINFKYASSPQAGSYLGGISVTAVPEPETYALMLAGLGLIGFSARRRKTQA